MTTFSPVKNVRIKSLTAGAVVQLRLGKAAVRSPHDVLVTAKFLSQTRESEKLLATFEETDADGKTSELVISRFPGAAWRSGDKYVSLVGVDESTYTIIKTTSPVQTDAIARAIKHITVEQEDVYAAEQLKALLHEIQTGKRINTRVKALAGQFAVKIAEELSNLPSKTA